MNVASPRHSGSRSSVTCQDWGESHAIIESEKKEEWSKRKSCVVDGMLSKGTIGDNRDNRHKNRQPGKESLFRPIRG